MPFVLKSLRVLPLVAAALAGMACQSSARDTPAPAGASPAAVAPAASTAASPAATAPIAAAAPPMAADSAEAAAQAPTAAPSEPAPVPEAQPAPAPGAQPAPAPGAQPAPTPAGKPGLYTVVLKDGRRIDCIEPPIVGMGRVLFKSPDGVTHAIKEDLVDTQATKLQPAPVPAPGSAPTPQVTQKAAPAPATASSERPPVPDFEAVRPDGSKVRLSELKGKVVLVDFWATWCGPCIREMPHVKAAYAKLAGPNFEILGVSLDRDRERFDAYLKEEGIRWPQYYDGKFWQNDVARAWGVSSIPMAVLIGKDGKVARVGLRGPELEFAVAELVSK